MANDADEAAREAALRKTWTEVYPGVVGFDFTLGWNSGRAYERERAEALAAAVEGVFRRDALRLVEDGDGEHAHFEVRSTAKLLDRLTDLAEAMAAYRGGEGRDGPHLPR